MLRFHGVLSTCDGHLMGALHHQVQFSPEPGSHSYHSTVPLQRVSKSSSRATATLRGFLYIIKIRTSAAGSSTVRGCLLFHRQVFRARCVGGGAGLGMHLQKYLSGRPRHFQGIMLPR